MPQNDAGQILGPQPGDRLLDRCAELVNPYRQAIEVRLLDQVPMQGNKDVELKLVRTEPPATPDPTTGGLQWRLTVPAGAKIETRFTYTLRRPKGARVYQ